MAIEDYLFLLRTKDNYCPTDGNGGCSHVCTNKEGFYECSCPDGAQLLQDGRTCSAPQQSASCGSNNGGCDQLCNDQFGVIQCGCRPGYVSAVCLYIRCGIGYPRLKNVGHSYCIHVFKATLFGNYRT